MRVLVTGSRGFVGPWLMAHLKDNGDEALELPEATDITDTPALAGAVTALGPTPSATWRRSRAFSAHGRTPRVPSPSTPWGRSTCAPSPASWRAAPRLLLVSSAEVYGRVPASHMPVTEDEPFAPATPYAASKASAEVIGMQAWLGRGTEVVRARAFNHTGPGQPQGFVVPDLASQVVRAARGELERITTGNIEVSRDIIDVRDVVRAYRLLLLHGEPGAAYNVCRGEAVVISDLLARLMRIAGTDVPVWTDPARARPADVPTHVGDPGRLKRLTGWEPEIPLDQTLADVLAAFRA